MQRPKTREASVQEESSAFDRNCPELTGLSWEKETIRLERTSSRNNEGLSRILKRLAAMQSNVKRFKLWWEMRWREGKFRKREGQCSESSCKEHRGYLEHEMWQEKQSSLEKTAKEASPAGDPGLRGP